MESVGCRACAVCGHMVRNSSSTVYRSVCRDATYDPLDDVVASLLSPLLPVDIAKRMHSLLHDVRKDRVPFDEMDPLLNVVLCENGYDAMNHQVTICFDCLTSLKKGDRPKFALVKDVFNVGVVPDYFRDLRLAEQWILGLQRPHAMMIRLRGAVNPVDTRQRAFVGNVIAYSQDVATVCDHRIIPASPSELCDMMYVVFVGKGKPPRESVDLSGLFGVRASVVRMCWEYLRKYNPRYRDIAPAPWCEDHLLQYPADGTTHRALWERIHVVDPATVVDADGDGYSPHDISVNSSRCESVSSGECLFVVVCVSVYIRVCVCVLCVCTSFHCITIQQALLSVCPFSVSLRS